MNLYALLSKAIEKAKVVQYHSFAVSMYLLPILAPNYGIKELAEKLVGYVAIGVGGIVIYVGARVLLGGIGFWKALLEVSGLVIAAGLVVEGGLRVFGGNSLGTVFYNLLVDTLSS